MEDEVSNSELLKFLLELEGFSVLVASNGKEALELLGRDRPDLIISDVMMPLMDGPELCKALAEIPECREIPMILMSAAAEKTLKNCHSAVAFFKKPLDLEDMLETIERVMGVAS